jgi:hypothetical protein
VRIEVINDGDTPEVIVVGLTDYRIMLPGAILILPFDKEHSGDVRVARADSVAVIGEFK